MKLRQITGQAGEHLHDFYDISHGWAEHWQKPIAAMRALVIYLEGVNDFGPQWVLTSHEDLVFTPHDDYRCSSVRVHPLGDINMAPAGSLYEISFAAPPPWSHTVGYAVNEEEAWEMIRSVLSKPSITADDDHKGV